MNPKPAIIVGCLNHYKVSLKIKSKQINRPKMTKSKEIISGYQTKSKEINLFSYSE